MFFANKSVENRPTAVNHKDIKNMERYVKAICDGNFSVPLPAVQDPQLQTLHGLLGQLVQRHQQDLLDISMEINTAVYEETHASEVLNKIALEYKVILQSVDALMDVVDHMADRINELASTAAETSQQTNAGREAMKYTETSVQSVAAETDHAQSNLQQITTRMKQLHASTADIDNLVAVVNGVSEQTNLLALNASIEAARAGEHGRGFSVVAVEVRKLADQSKESVNQIREQLTQIRSEVDHLTSAFSGMDESFQANHQAVSDASQHTGSLTQVFDGIGTAIQRLAPMTEEQSAAFEEMNATLRGTMDNVHQINDATKECNHDLYMVLRNLNGIRMRIGGMNLEFGPANLIEMAKTDHLIWRARINQMLWGNISLNAADVSNASLCRLGKWYHGTGQEKYGKLPVFAELGTVHERFHAACAEAIEAYQAGQEQKVNGLVEEIAGLSEKVMGYLDEIKAQLS